jgi:hypothetical protein
MERRRGDPYFEGVGGKIATGARRGDTCSVKF